MTFARRIAVLLLLLALAPRKAKAAFDVPAPPTCNPSDAFAISPLAKDSATPSDGEGLGGVSCAARWHGWCASRVEEFNAMARRNIHATHVGLWRGKQWRAAASGLRRLGCRAEWIVPSHPDAWHGLGTAAYGAWGRYWRAKPTPRPPGTEPIWYRANTVAAKAATSSVAGGEQQRRQLARLRRQLHGHRTVHPIVEVEVKPLSPEPVNFES